MTESVAITVLARSSTYTNSQEIIFCPKDLMQSFSAPIWSSAEKSMNAGRETTATLRRFGELKFPLHSRRILLLGWTGTTCAMPPRGRMMRRFPSSERGISGIRTPRNLAKSPASASIEKACHELRESHSAMVPPPVEEEEAPCGTSHRFPDTEAMRFGSASRMIRASFSISLEQA